MRRFILVTLLIATMTATVSAAPVTRTRSRPANRSTVEVITIVALHAYVAIQAVVTLHQPTWYAGARPPIGCHFVQQRPWRQLLFPHNTSTLLCWSEGVLDSSWRSE